MTVSEFAAKGGQAVVKKYGKGYMSDLVKKRWSKEKNNLGITKVDGTRQAV